MKNGFKLIKDRKIFHALQGIEHAASFYFSQTFWKMEFVTFSFQTHFLTWTEPFQHWILQITESPVAQNEVINWRERSSKLMKHISLNNLQQCSIRKFQISNIPAKKKQLMDPIASLITMNWWPHSHFSIKFISSYKNFSTNYFAFQKKFNLRFAAISHSFVSSIVTKWNF